MRHIILKKAIFTEISPISRFCPAVQRNYGKNEAPETIFRGYFLIQWTAARHLHNKQAAINLFSHPDYTVGTGIPSYQKVTGSAAITQFADYTAGWDLHPTPKILFLLRVLI